MKMQRSKEWWMARARREDEMDKPMVIDDEAGITLTAKEVMDRIDELREEASILSRKSHPEPGMKGDNLRFFRRELEEVERRIENLLPLYWRLKGWDS